MKFKKAFGVATLAATLTTTGILGGIASTPVMAHDAINVYRDGNNSPDVAITKSFAAPAGIDASELPKLTYTFKFERDKDSDVYTAGDPVEMYQYGDNVYATKAEADEAAEKDNNAQGDVTKITSNFADVATSNVEGLDGRTIDVTVDPATAEEYDDTSTTTPRAGVHNATTNAENTVSQKKVDTEKNVTYYRNETENFLKNDDGDYFTFTEEGVYAYYITEEATFKYEDGSAWTTKETTDPADGSKTTETITADTSKYRLLIYTEPDENGGFRIWAMTVVKVDPETNEVIGEKVDPTSGGNINIKGDLSNFEFQNPYKKVNDGGNNPEKSGYAVQKEVQGAKDQTGTVEINGDDVDYDYNDILWGDTTKGTEAERFKFTVTVKRSDLYPDDTSYTAKIWKGSSSGSTSWTQTGTHTFRFNEKGIAEETIYLTHYEKLAFDDMPVGTEYTVVEEDYVSDGKASERYGLNFKATTVTSNDADASNNFKASGAVPTDPYTTYYANNLGNGTTPTGILTNTIPFIVIIGGAIAAFVIVAVVKGKKRNEEA